MAIKHKADMANRYAVTNHTTLTGMEIPVFLPIMTGGSGASDSPTTYIGPLDLTEAAALVAYSQRALSSSLRGAALYTIRRDSDDHTQSFASDATTGEPPVVAIAAFIGEAAPLVALWNDQSGGGNDAGNATLAQQPTYVASLIGGKPAVQNVKNVTQLFTAGNIDVPDAFTAFLVWKCPDGDQGGAAFAMWNGVGNSSVYVQFSFNAGNNSNPIAASIEDEDGHLVLFNTFPEADHTARPPDPLLFDVALAFNACTAFVNGAAQFADESGGNADLTGVRTPSPLIIFNDYIPDPSDFGSALALSELIVFPAILADADRDAIRANIAAYYGIALG